MVVPLNTWVLISNFKLAYNLLRRPDGTFNRHLAEFLDRKVPANATAVEGVFSFDVPIDRSTNLLSRIYRPATGTDAYSGLLDIVKQDTSSTIVPVIIFFHGGSFTHSSNNSAIYDTLCRRFVSLCNAVVISVNYRRSPEYRYPCAYDDGWAALKWVTSQPGLRSGKDSKTHVFLAGDSSGGNIVHHVAVRAMESGIQVLGNILLNPMFGGEKRTDSEKRLDGKYFVTIQDRDWYWKAYLPEGANRDHPASNPFGPNGVKLEGLPFPKSLVVVASLDLVQDWQLAYADGLKRAGQDVKLIYLEQATVGFYLLPNTIHYYSVMEEIKNFTEYRGVIHIRWGPIEMCLDWGVCSHKSRSNWSTPGDVWWAGG
ncbi:Gibberellin receptor gid1c [Asimina triloba]